MRSTWRIALLGLVLAVNAPVRPAFGQSVQPPGTAACPGTQAAGTMESLHGTAGAYARWEKAIPDHTKLCRLKLLLDRQAEVLPERDLDDRSPLPKWFRVLLRKEHPDLATSGPYQYPKVANRILQGLLEKPDDPEIDRLLDLYAR